MLCLWPQVGHPKKETQRMIKRKWEAKWRPDPQKKKKKIEEENVKYLEVGEMVGGSLRVEGRERERGTSNQREKAGKGSLVCNGGNRRKRNSKGKAKKMKSIGRWHL